MEIGDRHVVPITTVFSGILWKQDAIRGTLSLVLADYINFTTKRWAAVANADKVELHIHSGH